ncbi:type II toxin-antitoxin system VapC family toxin [Moraxella nasibovis]|uniref:type II toxin-antitoxin system VapC family toxin n=1 Tax=Moraxella nasibovis TaxID=2904120 RepID=UPI00240F7A03|nr:type II toxin-antitoxin system VapC family toxin [Moraxella nasibovis]WFF39101.1 type II toxin-antitoxin system VapC family toxin [Moraxella nasibovis]
MRYLLDTNIVIAFQKQNANLLNKMYRYPIDSFAISSIVHFELVFGACNSQQMEKNFKKIKELPFEILDFNQNDGFYAGQIRSDLKAKGTPIGAYDTLIAGQTLANDLILITDNIKEFERVDGLKFENWLR